MGLGFAFTLLWLTVIPSRGWSAGGVTFTVNATADDPDSSPGDGVCETAPGNGVCTLRAAIAEANALPTDDTIAFDIPVTDPGYDGTGWKISLFSALPDLTGNLTMQGPSPHLIAIVRASADSFRILRLAGTGTVTVSGLSLSNGNAGGENGGAILNDGGGVLNLINCFVSYSQAYRGGGISNQSTSTTNLFGSLVTNNIAADNGGGITNQDTGVVNVTNCGVQFNQGTDGAGIRQSDLGLTTVTNSTVWGNLHNGASGLGGIGIYNASGGTLEVSNCTVSRNFGIGLTNNGSGSFLVKSSIVAQNGGPEGGPVDVFGTFNSSGFNLIGVVSGSSGFNQVTDQTGVLAPGLDPNGVQDNGGGLAPTVALVAGSPAIDRGSAAGLTGDLTTDQRGAGFVRPFDDPTVPNAIGGDGTDIGAFEAQTALTPPPTPTPTPTVTPTPTPRPTPTPPPPLTTFANISTRLNVGTGNNVLIGGFIITGSSLKTVIVRGIGPSLPVAGSLGDPFLTLFDSTAHVVGSDDNWQDSPSDAQNIRNSGLAPANDKEAALVKDLEPGAYTVVVSGVNNTTGIALVEVYDLGEESDSKLANISTRGLVQTGDNVMIGGIIVRGSAPTTALLRALGPSLPLGGTLSDPTLELHDSNGIILASNDNWKDAQEAEIAATGLAPPTDSESAVFISLSAGNYTAIVRGKNNSSGIALVEAYQIAP